MHYIRVWKQGQGQSRSHGKREILWDGVQPVWRSEQALAVFKTDKWRTVDEGDVVTIVLMVDLKKRGFSRKLRSYRFRVGDLMASRSQGVRSFLEPSVEDHLECTMSKGAAIRVGLRITTAEGDPDRSATTIAMAITFSSSLLYVEVTHLDLSSMKDRYRVFGSNPTRGHGKPGLGRLVPVRSRLCTVCSFLIELEQKETSGGSPIVREEPLTFSEVKAAIESLFGVFPVVHLMWVKGSALHLRESNDVDPASDDGWTKVLPMQARPPNNGLIQELMRHDVGSNPRLPTNRTDSGQVIVCATVKSLMLLISEVVQPCPLDGAIPFVEGYDLHLCLRAGLWVYVSK